MRDHIGLSTNVFHPAGTGRFPTILIRTPYGKGTSLVPNYRAFVDHGYVVVTQDVRGRYESPGVFSPLTQEAPDGDDTLNCVGLFKQDANSTNIPVYSTLGGGFDTLKIGGGSTFETFNVGQVITVLVTGSNRTA